MTTQHLDNANSGAILKPASALVELRGPSGKLYGMLDPVALVIEFKAQRRGSGSLPEKETIDLRPYVAAWSSGSSSGS